MTLILIVAAVITATAVGVVTHVMPDNIPGVFAVIALTSVAVTLAGTAIFV